MIRYSMIGACGILVAASPRRSQRRLELRPRAQSAPAARPVTRAQFIADMDAQFKGLDGNADRIVSVAETRAGGLFT